MNLLFFLTPKAAVSYLYSDYTLRQALERMESTRYAAIPILDRQGKYVGALTEGDLLWGCKNLCGMDLKRMEEHNIMEIHHHKDNRAVSANTDINDLIASAIDQNFIPVIDDKGDFIGLVTRRAVLKYCLENYIQTEAEE